MIGYLQQNYILKRAADSTYVKLKIQTGHPKLSPLEILFIYLKRFEENYIMKFLTF